MRCSRWDFKVWFFLGRGRRELRERVEPLIGRGKNGWGWFRGCFLLTE